LRQKLPTIEQCQRIFGPIIRTVAVPIRLSSFRKFLEPHVDWLRPKIGHRETDRKFETAWADATRIDIQHFILSTDEWSM
jgi:hypothetical protein